ncbi:MAG: aminoglycoside 6-adenylyltransferase [Chitinophagales bacterium]
MTNILSGIMSWAKDEPSVRTILMVGSKAQQGKQDKFSDFDLSIFGNSFDFITNDDWLEAISPVILCIHDQFKWGESSIPTRLTIFDDHTKVDFSFHPASLLLEMVSSQILTPTYEAGYVVVLDKDKIADLLPKAKGQAYQVLLPDKDAFNEAINEFWFEAYHIAKYLSREDFWAAKSRDHDMKKWMLRMLQWNAAANAPTPIKAKNEGRQMQDWIRPEWFNALEACFSEWDALSQWKALGISMKTFAILARETATVLGYLYNEKPESGLRNYILQLNPYSHVNPKSKSNGNH